jgi:hypothetical protein
MLVMTLRPRHRAHPLAEPAVAEEPTVHLAMEPDKRIPMDAWGESFGARRRPIRRGPGPRCDPDHAPRLVRVCTLYLSHPLSNNLVVQRKRVGGVTEGPYED